MNVLHVLLWGLTATVVFTTLLAGSQGFGLTRMSIPFMLGTIFTPDRDRAKLIGFTVHLLNGWWVAVVYYLTFADLGQASWLLGAGLGILHALVILVVIMPLLPGLHPRMASEQRGPTPTRLLEPPGFLALHYGRRTPILIIVAHAVYGAILGASYRPL